MRRSFFKLESWWEGDQPWMCWTFMTSYKWSLQMLLILWIFIGLWSMGGICLWFYYRGSVAVSLASEPLVGWDLLLILTWVRKRMFWSYHLYKYAYTWHGGHHLEQPALSSINQHHVWRLCQGGFYLDELYARVLEKAARQVFILPAIFILDKWVSCWMASMLTKSIGSWLANVFFVERLGLVQLINILIISFILSWLLLSFILLIYV